MEKTTFLYFRQVTDMASDGLSGDTQGPGSVMYPASSFRYMNPTADGTISLYFENMRVDPTTAGPKSDTVSLTVTQGKEKEAMIDIMSTINPNPTDGFIVMADDCVITDSATTALNDKSRNSFYCSPHVTAVSAISVHNSDHGYGVHEYSEVVDIALDVADNSVAGNLLIKIPPQAHITYAAITPVELAGNDIGSLALEVHSAHDTGASGGTEIIGAEVAGNKSLPDADLDISSNAVVGKSITMGTLAEVQRSTENSFFALVAKADMTSTPMTGTPKVAVYLKWFGPSAVSRIGTN